MSWFKKAVITSFENSPQNIEEARTRYFDGDEMVRYHVIYDLYKMNDIETVEYAAKNDPSPLVKNMAQKCLEKMK